MHKKHKDEIRKQNTGMLFRGSRTHRAYLDANAPTKTYGFLTPRDRDIVSRIETVKTFSVFDHSSGTEPRRRFAITSLVSPISFMRLDGELEVTHQIRQATIHLDDA